MSGSSAQDEASISRRRDGPLASVAVSRAGLLELYGTCAPQETIGADDAAAEAREVYGALDSWLRENGAVGVQERIFGSLKHREAILAEREAALGAVPEPGLWPATFVQGAPCDRDGLAGVHLYAVTGPKCSPIHDEGRLWGVVLEHGDARHVHLSGLCGPGSAGSRQEEARAMFARADAALRATGCSYADVVRTWIYVADILDWYDQFNWIRSAIYSELCPVAESGSRWLPASTGIEARPPAGAPCVMDLFALGGAGRRRVSVEGLRNPLQSEAYSYGSAFSRGTAVAFDGAETVHVSGTAAVDERGRSVCVGDCRAQVSRTLDHIAALLNTRRMTLDDFVSSTIFIKHGQDATAVRQFIDQRGGRLANSIYVAADICRPELLFEADGIAVRALA